MLEQKARQRHRILKNFLAKNPQFQWIRWSQWELTIYFPDSLEPWGVREFVKGSGTRMLLESLQKQLEEIA